MEVLKATASKLGAKGAEASGKLFRLKTVGSDFLETQLKRCLSTFDITLLGVGHMIGAGVYVLTGSVAHNMAGPGIILSFLFAGIASLLSALCYAEFGARVPKAGSAYTYTYVTVGEFWAFTIGWNIILEHMLGAAAVARSWSGYLDSLMGHVIKNGTIAAVGKISIGNFFGDYPDFIAFFVVIVVALFMGYGTKTSTNFNTIFTIINMFVILFVIIFGFTLADLDNWKYPDGFLPKGFSGVLAGAASCFFAYIGFDAMATSGEEARDPGKSIPIATFVSMSIVSASYILMSGALTLMVPYDQIHPTSAFADAFETRGVGWAKYVVAIGALSGMTTSLVGSLFALPRCVYAMAKDGLIFRTLAQIHPKTQVPTLAVTVFGSVTAVIALLFDIETLVEFLSIGTLMAYTIVSSSVIILRYQPSRITDPHAPKVESALEQIDDDTEGLVGGGGDAMAGKLKVRYGFLEPVAARFKPGSLPAWAVLSMIANFFIVAAVTANGYWYEWWVILLTLIFGLGTVASFLLICAHHQGDPPARFHVPLVPLVPSVSVCLNLILMLHLAPVTWIRLVIWLGAGYLVYFFYGLKHSEENPEARENYDTLICTPASTPGKEAPHFPPTSIEHPQPTDATAKTYGTETKE